MRVSVCGYRVLHKNGNDLALLIVISTTRAATVVSNNHYYNYENSELVVF